jgi:hypothetical protein
MAWKISFKRAALNSFSLGVVLVVCACMNPIDLQTFIDDPVVQGVIETTRKTVKVDDKTGDDLKGLNGRIEGLKGDKYYLVEKEVDADGVNVPKYNDLYPYPLFVTDAAVAQIPGGLYPDLGVITRISPGEGGIRRINGLENYHKYTVRAAEPFPNGTEFVYRDNTGASKTVTVTNGTITIPNPKAPVILTELDTDLEDYEVMAVAVTPAALPTTTFFSGKKTIGPAAPSVSSFQLEGPDTTVDYVFFKSNGVFSPDFKVLKVIVEPVIQAVNLTLNIEFSVDNGIGQLNPNSRTINQSDYYNNQTVNISITTELAGSGYTNPRWIDENGVDAGSAISPLNLTNINYLAKGAHIFTLKVEKDGKPYSVDFTLTVN